MRERLDRAWRVLATGACFALFGLGGLALRVTVFPLLRVLVRDPARRAPLARAVIGRAFRGFISTMTALGVITWEVRNGERMHRRGLLILANHPSLIDVVFLMAFVQRADCIVKAALARNPFTRGPVESAGFVCNDAGPGMLDAAIASLRAGNNLIVFPEGTRSPRSGTPQLRRGAANIAVRGAVNVTPVRIQVTPPTLAKGERWYGVPVRRPHFLIDVGEDIDVSHFIAQSDSAALAARRLTHHLVDYFTPEAVRAVA